MNLTLYYKIYGEGVDEQVILKYTGYAKPRHLYSVIKDHIWRAQPKVES